MKFCSICNNMVYVKVSDDKPQRISYGCRFCGNTEDCIATESICVIDNNYNDKEARYKQYMTKYLKYDKTLPHYRNIACPNESCKSQDPSIVKDVISVKYDFDNMKYIYHCVHCEAFWRT